jgi:isopentenyl-diphosphate delta-isomerase
MSDIEKRKDQHLDIVLSGVASSVETQSAFAHIRFEHNALPEIDLDQVDLSTSFLSHRLSAPLLISSMTGGPRKAEALNRHIAEACNHLGLAFGVGSQRIALEGGNAAGLGRALRNAAPNAPILANFGAAQLKQWNGVEMANRALDMIDADGLIIHLNPLQEAVQAGGDTAWSGLLERIEAVCRAVERPVIAKEVGAGISANVARRLMDAGVAGIDVAGFGGTNWAVVEAARAETDAQRAIGQSFRNWGIPTPDAIVAVRDACPDTLLIGSGGINDGIDCAKAIRLGADMTALAGPLLESAIESTDALIIRLETIIAELRIACFCTGSRDLARLREAPLLPTPPYRSNHP